MSTESTQEKPALEPPKARWNLSSLFAGIDDPAVDASWQTINQQAEAFAAKYRGKINSPDLTAQLLADSLKEIEDLCVLIAKPVTFGQLLFAADASDAKIGAFMQKQMERYTEVNVKLMFHELELQAVADEVLDPLVNDPALANYTHYIGMARKFRSFRLSEKEEILMEELANTGSRAWNRLFDEVLSNHVFEFKNPQTGETEELSQQEVLNLLRDASRETRQAAADSLSQGLESLERVLVFIFNNLIQDKAVDDRLRGYEYPEQARHLGNELDRETVDLVMRLCGENYGLVARYYHVKREILGLEKLTHIDRYAPLFDTEEEVSWEEGQQIVLDAFGGFSTEMAARAKEFFDKEWIDAEPRKGKTGGAFCSYNTPDTHPVILQSYLNKMDDVMTLAHELGHGVHASLSRAQSYFNFHGTLPLAELASTFGEMLVFEKLVAAANEQDKLALYADKIEGIFATVFRQAAMYRFEQSIHRARKEEGELDGERFGELWHNEIQSMFGDSVEMGEQHRRWWSYVGHFTGSPFYVYAYSFGELVVLSLYEMAKEQGPEFVDKYIEMLRLGGSKSPDELMELVGVNLRDEAFWQGGFKVIERFIGTFESLYAASKS